MKMNRILAFSAALIMSVGVCAAKTHHAKRSSSSQHAQVQHASKSGHRSSRHSRRGAWKRHGQQEIKGDRATEIQEALIREKYLDGTPSGEWDARTQQAMAHYQADHGWQSKVTPDSRALIKLGLGPSHAQDLVSSDPRVNADAASASVADPHATPSRR